MTKKEQAKIATHLMRAGLPIGEIKFHSSVRSKFCTCVGFRGNTPHLIAFSKGAMIAGLGHDGHGMKDTLGLQYGFWFLDADSNDYTIQRDNKLLTKYRPTDDDIVTQLRAMCHTKQCTKHRECPREHAKCRNILCDRTAIAWELAHHITYKNTNALSAVAAVASYHNPDIQHLMHSRNAESWHQDLLAKLKPVPPYKGKK